VVSARQSANGRRSDTGRHEQLADWAAAYQPAEGTPLLACRCGGRYLDDEPARDAHRAVFGHIPRPREPADVRLAEVEADDGGEP
jgi:hypothetical protein